MIAVLGITKDDLAASEYAKTVLGLSTTEIIENSLVPHVDLQLEKTVQETCLRLIDECLINSAHDCSDGGLAVAIAESCFSSLGRKAIGAEIALIDREMSHEADLFGETPSRIVISFSRENEARIRELIGDCPMTELGWVTGDTLNISINSKPVVSAPIIEIESSWRVSLKNRLEN
jgi:phosphoribosylformylglycinamidine synthase